MWIIRQQKRNNIKTLNVFFFFLNYICLDKFQCWPFISWMSLTTMSLVYLSLQSDQGFCGVQVWPSCPRAGRGNVNIRLGMTERLRARPPAEKRDQVTSVSPFRHSCIMLRIVYAAKSPAERPDKELVQTTTSEVTFYFLERAFCFWEIWPGSRYNLIWAPWEIIHVNVASCAFHYY